MGVNRTAYLQRDESQPDPEGLEMAAPGSQAVMRANNSGSAVLGVSVPAGFTEQGKCVPPSAFLFSPLTGSVGMP